MLRIGITGQEGFIGTHLFNFLALQEGVECIHFEKSFFREQDQLRGFVKDCDVIVHLAAMNRHHDPETLYQTNIHLVQQLIDAMEAEGVAPHIIFSSSTQEERDNVYGRSKREGKGALSSVGRTAKCNFHRHVDSQCIWSIRKSIL